MGARARLSPSPASRRELRALRRRAGPDAVLAVQRMAGNGALGQILARKEADTPPPATAVFNVLIVDDGGSGLSKDSMKAAIETVQREFKAVTDASESAAVKAGFNVKVVESLPPGQPRDIGKRSFVVFLLRGKDAEKAAQLASEHIDVDMSEGGRKAFTEHVKKQFASEGGVNREWIPENPRKWSKSVGFVSTDLAVDMQTSKSLGPAEAGRTVGEVICHELGHAMGHPDHGTGIMTGTLVLGSDRRAPPGHFSTDSSRKIRERLEWLASK